MKTLLKHFAALAKQTLVWRCAGIGVFMLPVLAQAQSNYAVFELNREQNWDTLITQDMNGDDRLDLVYASYDPLLGRELLIHHQQESGSFTSEPTRIEIKKEIIAVGFADLRSDPGMELVLYASSGVFSLSTTIQGYAGNLKPLLQWDLIAAVPDLERVAFIENLSDINNDGFIDILLPSEEGYGVFLGSENESFEKTAVFSTDDETSGFVSRFNTRSNLDTRLGINAQQGVVVEVTVDAAKPFANFLEPWNKEKSDQDSMLRTDSWVSNGILSPLNSDALKDIIYLNVAADGNRQINIHYQSATDGFSSTPDWTGQIDPKGELQLEDINGDGLTDIMLLKGSGNELDARLFVNKGGSFSFEQADQVMRFSGYDVRLETVKLTADSAPILSANYYTIPVVDAIRSASLNRIQLLYSSEQSGTGGVFSRRPIMSFEETFSASNVLGLSEQMTLKYDVNGDGKADALYVTENGSIAAKSLDDSFSISDEPFWEFVSTRNIFEFEVLSLNADSLPDLILRHGTSISVLVARP